MVRKERRHIVYILLLASVLLLFIPLSYSKAMIVGANSLFAPIEKPLYQMLHLKKHNLSDEFSAKEQLLVKIGAADKEARKAQTRADQLLAENARLKEQLSKFGQFQELCGEVPPERRLLATVCGINQSRGAHFIFIDRGADQGVEEYYGVVSGGYVIGEVAAVSKNYSIVRLVTDPALYLRVRIRETRVQKGLMVAGSQTQPGKLLLSDYPRNEAPLQPQYFVETSGLDGFFDSGLPVGIVETVTPPTANQLFSEALVRPLADLEKLETVFVIAPKLSPAERKELLKSVTDKKNTN